MGTGVFVLDFFLGMVGLAYLVYGKKQRHVMALISGFGLSVFPFFTANLWLTLVLGALFGAAPFLIEL